MIIGVIGGAQTTPEMLAQADSVGRELAHRGCVLICGGLGGVMEAACRGAQQAGGTTIGVLPGDDRHEANAYVTLPIVTGIGRARNVIVALTSEALIAVDGGYGTLSELGFALQFGRPVVGIGTWRFGNGAGEDASIVRCEDVVQAVDKAIELARGAGTLAPRPL
ncbi:MAG TPA: TIGR00725 family protein [Dehalococcoidia bacterium]|nr:TIGR00725 family protein [Dehalococcoidia bacterium]